MGGMLKILLIIHPTLCTFKHFHPLFAISSTFARFRRPFATFGQLLGTFAHFLAVFFFLHFSPLLAVKATFWLLFTPFMLQVAIFGTFGHV